MIATSFLEVAYPITPIKILFCYSQTWFFIYFYKRLVGNRVGYFQHGKIGGWTRLHANFTSSIRNSAIWKSFFSPLFYYHRNQVFTTSLKNENRLTRKCWFQRAEGRTFQHMRPSQFHTKFLIIMGEWSVIIRCSETYICESPKRIGQRPLENSIVEKLNFSLINCHKIRDTNSQQGAGEHSSSSSYFTEFQQDGCSRTWWEA